MEATLLNQGVMLMLVGMGTVFAFLTVLVLAMSLMAGIVKRLQPAPAESISEDEVAAIAAAISLHRKKNS